MKIFKKKSSNEFNVSNLKKNQSIVFVDKSNELCLIDGETKQLKKQKHEQLLQTIYVLGGYTNVKLNPKQYSKVELIGYSFVNIDVENFDNNESIELFCQCEAVKLRFPENWHISDQSKKYLKNNIAKEQFLVCEIEKINNQIYCNVKFNLGIKSDEETGETPEFDLQEHLQSVGIFNQKIEIQIDENKPFPQEFSFVLGEHFQQIDILNQLPDNFSYNPETNTVTVTVNKDEWVSEEIYFSISDFVEEEGIGKELYGVYFVEIKGSESTKPSEDNDGDGGNNSDSIDWNDMMNKLSYGTVIRYTSVRFKKGTSWVISIIKRGYTITINKPNGYIYIFGTTIPRPYDYAIAKGTGLYTSGSSIMADLRVSKSGTLTTYYRRGRFIYITIYNVETNT